MKTINTSIALVLIMVILPFQVLGSEKTLMGSVYLESMNALQQQLQQAATVFEAQELGMLPFAIAMMVPGASQLDMNHPIALHLFYNDEGQISGVLEIKPTTSGDQFMNAVTASLGQSFFKDDVGDFVFTQGLAREHDGNVLFSTSKQMLDAYVQHWRTKLAPMPDLNGAIRTIWYPSAAVPSLIAMLQNQQQQWSLVPGNESFLSSVDTMIDLYMDLLGQLERLETSVGVASQGLMVESRLSPAASSDIGKMLASMQPPDDAYLSLVDRDALVSMATGSYSVPERLLMQGRDALLQLMSLSPDLEEATREHMERMLDSSLAMAGAANALQISGSSVQALTYSGAVAIPDADNHLATIKSLMDAPVYHAYLKPLGITIASLPERTYGDIPVLTWSLDIDESLWGGNVHNKGNALPGLFMGSISTYAATPHGLAYGSGSETAVDGILDRLTTTTPSTQEAQRIRSVLSPAQAPVSIGRLALVDLVRLFMEAQADQTAVVPQGVKGEGVLFCSWLEQHRLRSVTLIPAADIKAMRVMMPTVNPAIALPF